MYGANGICHHLNGNKRVTNWNRCNAKNTEITYGRFKTAAAVYVSQNIVCEIMSTAPTKHIAIRTYEKQTGTLFGKWLYGLFTIMSNIVV